MPEQLGAAFGVDLTDCASFEDWQEDVIRYDDIDMLDHVTHPAYVYLFQNGRLRFWQRRGAVPDLVAARITVDYLHSLTYPGTARTGTRILRFGRSSITLGQGMFDKDGRCAATLLAVSVLTDRTTGRSRPWPEDLKARLEQPPTPEGEAPAR
jgi:acyl-CoA thioester hydrolase